MDHLLTAVKSVRKDRQDDASTTLLTAVKSTNTNKSPPPPSAPPPLNGDSNPTIAKSPEEALHILRSRPDVDQLVNTLDQLRQRQLGEAPFSLVDPGPLQAQIINSLVVETLPTFWPVLTSRQRLSLSECLLNVAGVNAIITRLKQLCSTADKSEQSTQLILDLIRVIENLFNGENALSTIHQTIQTDIKDSKRRELIWKEFVNLVASGKIISTIARAEDVAKTKKQSWVSTGELYSAWLGRNIASLNQADIDSNGITAAAQALGKALNLGYSNALLRGYFGILLRGPDHQSMYQDAVKTLLLQLPAHSKRQFTEHAIRWISSVSLQSASAEENDRTVAAVGACISALAQDSQVNNHLTAFLTDPTLCGSITSVTRRAIAAVLSNVDDTDDLYAILEKLIATFADRVFIDHAQNLQQESTVETLLLLSGYLHRQNPVAFLVLARSSHAIHGISNRLDSSNSRARWLGMVVGTAISQLADKPGSRMDFGSHELDTDESKRYLDLVVVRDRVGTIETFSDLLNANLKVEGKSKLKMPIRTTKARDQINGKPIFGPSRPPVQTEIIGERVTEVLEDGDGDEDDLKPYAKPDSDPEDSDEDATLVNRHKVKPPVYIRDLMSMLRDDKSHDRFEKGIKHAATLIRRKADFGAEVKDHAEELTSILCNLRDPFETDDFEELKIRALIALLLADVNVIAPRLCQQAFSGDYSIAQRCIILSAIGLGGRELAGFLNEDALNPVPKDTSFPSKRLPPHLHSIYSNVASTTQRLNAASAEMERQLIQPIALQAADESTSHLNAVKVRTFSSRMDVERTKRKPAPNQLAKVFGSSFFFPLSNRYQQEISAYGKASAYASVPFVLVTFLRTLALLLHACGPTTVDLTQITTEFWDLLLSLRAQAISDLTILQAVLFSFLTLLEVNSDNKRQIAWDLPKHLMETQQWVDMVFERTGSGNLIDEQDTDEAKIRTLAAGVLVKVKEIIDAYHQQLVGYMP